MNYPIIKDNLNVLIPLNTFENIFIFKKILGPLKNLPYH